ncbi:MAG: hypothetical protein MJ217_01765 [Bacilli bacterium]|nr:hypothetical protein [Bacilli bacterium]
MIKLLLFISTLFCQFNSTIGNIFSFQSCSSKGVANEKINNELHDCFDNQNHSASKAPGESFIRSGSEVFIEQNYDYHSFTSFSMESYFYNLDLFSPVNYYDSCGFVSLIQVLSYYDTFYNDEIIPEVYEGKREHCTSESEVVRESPGVKTVSPFRYIDTFNTRNYYTYCHSACAEDFQCQLTCTYNRSVLHSDNSRFFQNKISCYYYQDLLDAYYGPDFLGVNTYSFDHSNSDQTFAIEIVKHFLDKGVPLIAHVEGRDGEDDHYHSVVIYEYDDDFLYTHFGYGTAAHMFTRVNLLSVYKYITDLAVIDVCHIDHVHSDNYMVNEKGYCGCNLTDRIEMWNYQSFLNYSPTFYWMKNDKDPFEMYDLSFVSDVTDETLYHYILSGNSCILSNDTWRDICNKTNSQIKIVFKRLSNYGMYPSKTTTFLKPTERIQSKVIWPSDYHFADAYPTDSITKDEYITHSVDDEFSFRTRRYRTGYIQREAVVMSCIKKGINEAFIEYSFDVGITSIQVELSHWREYTNEHLDKDSGIAELQIWDSDDIYGNWVRKMDLLSDETNLPRDRNHPTLYNIVFDQPVYAFRFYERVNNMENSSSNKGRICIGNITLHFEN